MTVNIKKQFHTEHLSLLIKSCCLKTAMHSPSVLGANALLTENISHTVTAAVSVSAGKDSQKQKLLSGENNVYSTLSGGSIFVMSTIA